MNGLYNDSERISANEINKFTYCPYQWYYERKYGRKYLREARSELLKSLGHDDSTKSNFVKGLEFHKNFKTRSPLFSFIKLLAILILLAIFIFFILSFEGVLPWIFLT